MGKKKLKLYVWEHVLREYSYGIAFAYAYDIEQARELLRIKMGRRRGLKDFRVEPIEVAKENAFYLYGSS